MNNGGFVITIDSFLGIALLFVLISMSFYYFSQVSISAWNTIDARNIVNDEANALVKGLVLESAVNQSSSEIIYSSINSTPSSYCFAVTISSVADPSDILYSVKTGCVKSGGDIYSVNKLLAVRPGQESGNMSFYMARIEGWVK